MKNLLTPKRWFKSVLLYGILACVVVIFAPILGPESVDFSKIIFGHSQEYSVDKAIFWQMRMPRVMLAFIVGAVLSVVGAVMQVILRNPLATPYTLGVTGGSAVGACLAITLPTIFGTSGEGIYRFGIFSMVQLFALGGSFIVLFFIYLLASKHRNNTKNTILLAGVSIGVLCTAINLLLGYLASPNDLVSMYRWMIGGLGVIGYNQILSILPLLIPGMGMLFYIVPSLNHLALGEALALGHGVDVVKVHRLAFIGGGMAAAAVVSISGPIGFVGLVIPHIVRRLSGYDHRVIIPASLLLGGSFMVFCDTIARTAITDTEMPVGIVTAIIGAPFFIHLLLRTEKN